MLSIIVPARNSHRFTSNCLASVRHTVDTLGLTDRVQYVLIDDCSDEKHGIQPLFIDFKAKCGAECVISRLPTWGHYTASFARGMELATGENLFLLSNDMMLTPDFLRTLLAVQSLDSSNGIVRGTSPHCDSHPEYNTRPAPAPRNYAGVERFSSYVASVNGLAFTEDKLLSGDAVLIRRSLIDAIGPFDTQFFGYFGDVDLGVRARRAGYKLVCAMGAWLHHEGGGHIRCDREALNGAPDTLHDERMALVNAAWQKFRAKWGIAEPVEYDITRRIVDFIDFDKLCS